MSAARGERVHTVVVGGGISGLTLGYRLRRRGVDVRVVEGSERPGGNIFTELRDGYRCEWGPNGFLDNEPATLRLAADLGLTAALAPAASEAAVRWIVRGGRLRELPAKPAAFLVSGVLSLPGRLRALLEWAQPAGTEDDEPVWEFARRRIGREAADVLVDAMVTGVYAGDPRRLSLVAAFPRMREMERKHGSLLRAMRAAKAARRAAMKAAGEAQNGAAAKAPGGPFGPGGTLTSFRDGMGTLIDALAQSLNTHLECGRTVAAMSRLAGGWRLDFESGPPIECEQVVLACPAWRAAPLVAPWDHALAADLEAIPSAPVAVVSVGYREVDVAHVRRGFGFLVPNRERLGVLGTLFDSWVFPGRAPDGMVLWRTMLGGARDRGAVDRNDAELQDRVLGVYGKLLKMRAQPQFVAMVRHWKGIPQYPVHHTKRLTQIQERLTRHGGLRLAGNSYHGVAMNSCIREAEEMAQQWPTR